MAVLGGVVELQPLRNPTGLWRRERLVQGRRTVRVQVVHDHPHHRGLRVSFVHQPTHLMGEVLHRAPLGHRHMTPARQRLTGQEQVADALPPVFVVLSPEFRRRDGRVSANNWVDLPTTAKKLTRAQIRQETFFLDACAPLRGTCCGHALPAAGCRPRRSGGPRPGRPASGAGWPGDEIFRTPANPSWVKRCLTRYTVPRATSRASATWGAGQPSSLLRRTRALAVTRAGCFPTRIRRWSSSRPPPAAQRTCP